MERRASGSARHTVLVNIEKPGILSAPRHSRVKAGTLRSILKAAGLAEDQFWQHYWRTEAGINTGRSEQAAVGFEPTNNGFANRRLRPLGYAAS